MKTHHRLLIFWRFLFISASGLAQQGLSRDTRLEWDPIPKAKSYDLEIYDSKQALIIQKNVSDFFSEDSMVPGKYFFKIRSRDQRNVPGPWSPLSEFDVALLKPKIAGPAIEDLNVSEVEEKVRLSWDAVPLAEKYNVVIENTRSGDKKVLESAVNEVFVDLKVNETYRWSVEAINIQYATSEPSDFKTLTLIPKKMDSIKEVKANVAQLPAKLTWEPRKNVVYEYKLIRILDSGTQVLEAGRTKESNFVFKPQYQEGKYIFEIKTKKEGFPDSDIEAHNIKWNGLSRRDRRLVASDNEVEVNRLLKTRRGIERSEGYFMHASTLISQLIYSSRNMDSNSDVNFQALGAIARVGFGFEQPESKFSYQSVFEAAGYYFNNQIQNYFSLEGSSLFRSRIRTFENIKIKAGLTYKEQIDVSDLAPGSGSNIFSFQKVAYLGPHLGVNYSYSLSSRIGVEGFTQLTASALSLSSPNGNAVRDSSELRIGLLSSYKVTKTLTGLVGYTFQSDHFQYGSSIAGGKNEVKLTGHFLHLLTEWNF